MYENDSDARIVPIFPPSDEMLSDIDLDSLETALFGKKMVIFKV